MISITWRQTPDLRGLAFTLLTNVRIDVTIGALTCVRVRQRVQHEHENSHTQMIQEHAINYEATPGH